MKCDFEVDGQSDGAVEAVFLPAAVDSYCEAFKVVPGRY